MILYQQRFSLNLLRQVQLRRVFHRPHHWQDQSRNIPAFHELPRACQESCCFPAASNTGLSVYSGLANQTLLETQIALESMFPTLQIF